MHVVQLLHQKPVMRGQMNLLVKPLVGLAEGARIAAQQGLVVGHHPLQHAQFLVGGVARGQSGGQGFKLGADGVKLAQLVVIQRGHNQRAPVPAQHRLGLQPLQRFAHRRARDPKAFGQFGFHQPVTGFEYSCLDGIEDQREGVLLHRSLSP